MQDGDPSAHQTLVSAAARELQKLALDEEAKERLASNPSTRPFMDRIARRYVAGRSIDDVLARVVEVNGRGHAATVDYMGESCREASKANAATDVFLALVDALSRGNPNCSISLDLSHIGSLVDPELGFRNADRIALAAAQSGREVMISVETSDRADSIYGTYARLHSEAGRTNVGITVPAKVHRTEGDLAKLQAFSGRIRLTKGAYVEPDGAAYERGNPELAERYLRLATQLLKSGHTCSLATHDRSIQAELCAFITGEGIAASYYEFETLLGLGTAQIDELHRRGFPTREYVVFGEEQFLYVLNRIAEEPVRVYQAIIDALSI